MKIAFFTDCFLDLSGGIVSVIKNEKKALEERGHTVYVFSSSFKKSEKELKKLAAEHIFPVKSCKVFGRGISPIARRPGVIEKDILKTHPEIKDFDIYYIHYEAGCSIAGLKLGQKYHIPTIQVMHGREDMGVTGLIPYGLRTIVAGALNLFHSWYLPHPVRVKKDNYLADTAAKAKMWTLMVNHANAAGLVLTPSEHFRKKLVHYGVIKPIISMHHGLKSELLEVKTTPRELKKGETLEIIWASRISGEKRPMVFLEALSKLDFRSYHVSIYGDGPDLKKAKRYAMRHRLNITFCGAKPFSEVKKGFLKAHLSVLSSYNYDTFGMSLIESIALGVPVLFTDPDMEEIVPKGSFILSPTPDAEGIARSLKGILSSPESINKMSKIAINSRKDYEIFAKIKNLEKTIKNMLQN